MLENRYIFSDGLLNRIIPENWFSAMVC
jgi:hypothetical protein